MAAESGRANTRNAATRDQPKFGTGQRSTTPPDTLKMGRSDLSPSKVTGGEPKFSNVRRGETFDAQGLSVPAQERNAKMVTDSGPKTERERTFNRINAELRQKLDGTQAQGGRDFFPTQYERQKADYARDDKYAGAKPNYRPKQNQ